MWQRRYFILCESGLVYYKDKADFDAGNDGRGWIPILRIVQVEVANTGKGSEEGRRLNIFIQGADRVFELMAGSRSACAAWASKLSSFVEIEEVQEDSKKPIPENMLWQGTLIKIFYAGDMSKKSSMNRHLWQARYFVLTEAGLIYFKDREEFEALRWRGCIPLNKISQVIVASVGKGSESGRRINLLLVGHEKVFELMADGREACLMWAACITKALLAVPRKKIELDPQSISSVASVPEQKKFIWTLIDGIRTCARECAVRGATFAVEGENDSVWSEEISYAFPGDVTMVDWTPRVFQNIRHRMGVSTPDYLAAWDFNPDDLPVLELGAGRSGSLFMFSRDRRFLLKTIPLTEVASLKLILKDLYNYYTTNRTCKLARILALHRYDDPHTFGYVYLIILMNSLVLPGNRLIDAKFDLKGRVPKRSDRKATPARGMVWKDNQITRTFHCSERDREVLLQGLTQDVAWLKNHNLMDYSLLVGVHYCEGVDFDTGTKLNIDMPPTQTMVTGHDEVYLIQIIDFLSPYGAKKKMAHFVKNLIWTNDTLSTVPASFYHDRFLAYLPSLFTTCHCHKDVGERKRTQTLFRLKYIESQRVSPVLEGQDSSEEEDEGDEAESAAARVSAR